MVKGSQISYQNSREKFLLQLELEGVRIISPLAFAEYYTPNYYALAINANSKLTYIILKKPNLSQSSHKLY